MLSAPSSGPRGKNAHPSRGVFNTAMEDAPSDDETPSAVALKPASKHVAPAHKAATPPPQATPKASHSSAAGAKPQPQHSTNKKTTHAKEAPSSNESDATHSTSELKPLMLGVTAGADSADDGGDVLASTVSSSTQDNLASASSSTQDAMVSNVNVESTPLQAESGPDATPLASASSASGDALQVGSPRPSQTIESVGPVPTLKPMPSAKPVIALKALPSTPRATSFSTDSSPMALPAKTHAPLHLEQVETADIADAVHVDLLCFAPSNRHVQPFCESEDEPLPHELSQLQPSSDLATKIESGELCISENMFVVASYCAVLSVDIAAEVGRIVVDVSSRADALSTILPSPVVMDVADDKDCMSVAIFL